MQLQTSSVEEKQKSGQTFEVVDSYNLKEYIDRHKGKKALAKPVTQVELNLNYILAMM